MGNSGLKAFVFMMVFWSSGQSVHATTAEHLPIAERLQSQPVLLLGWMHSSSNKIIPKILLAEVRKMLEQGQLVTIVIEWPEGMREDFYNHYPAGGNMASLGKTIDAVRAMGAEIIAGDAPALGPQNDVSDLTREKYLAENIEKAFNRGRKVIEVVGGKHLLGVSRNLRRLKVPFTSISTQYNVLTGEVRWGEKSLGFTDFDYRFIDGRHTYPQSSWDKVGWGPSIRDPEDDVLYSKYIEATYAVRTFYRKCAALLIGGR